ncbi:hypothetical protein [Bacillus cereus]|uniref:Uncharacterized protein n=1 Tax=Bacillus cereus HuA4-10 TaxID=1053206 RepID=J8D016_BACCE|nr:hypothetical protein [Bacillus cereus]EJQ72887.1 hypothetical protein IGC_05141 [Bacillus cereus HuA4-10]
MEFPINVFKLNKDLLIQENQQKVYIKNFYEKSIDIDAKLISEIRKKFIKREEHILDEANVIYLTKNHVFKTNEQALDIIKLIYPQEEKEKNLDPKIEALLKVRGSVHIEFNHSKIKKIERLKKYSHVAINPIYCKENSLYESTNKNFIGIACFNSIFCKQLISNYNLKKIENGYSLVVNINSQQKKFFEKTKENVLFLFVKFVLENYYSYNQIGIGRNSVEAIKDFELKEQKEINMYSICKDTISQALGIVLVRGREL